MTVQQQQQQQKGCLCCCCFQWKGNLYCFCAPHLWLLALPLHCEQTWDAGIKLVYPRSCPLCWHVFGRSPSSPHSVQACSFKSLCPQCPHPAIHPNLNVSASSFELCQTTLSAPGVGTRPWRWASTQRTMHPSSCLPRQILPLNTEANEAIRITVVWRIKRRKANSRMHAKFSCVRGDTCGESAFKHTAFAIHTV